MELRHLARHLVVGAAITATALVGTPTAGLAAPPVPTTEADLVGVVQIDRADASVATVLARYRCTGEGALWISVKQAPSLTADPRLALPGSSALSAGRWSHSHRNAVTCDGTWQLQRFVVDQEEFGGSVDLAKGEAYVQFCLFDDQHPAGEEGHGEPLSQNEFLHVR